MSKEAFIAELRATQKFFEKSTACLKEEDSDFAPAEGMFTAAQQVAHAALSVDWFVEGAFRPEGFDMDFEKHLSDARQVTSLAEARKLFTAAFDRAVAATEARSEEELAVPLPEGPVMGGAPRSAIYGGITDHTAHHRGALTVYSRLRGYEPDMPY